MGVTICWQWKFCQMDKVLIRKRKVFRVPVFYEAIKSKLKLGRLHHT